MHTLSFFRTLIVVCVAQWLSACTYFMTAPDEVWNQGWKHAGNVYASPQTDL